jgi:hypothetical protein
MLTKNGKLRKIRVCEYILGVTWKNGRQEAVMCCDVPIGSPMPSGMLTLEI